MDFLMGIYRKGILEIHGAVFLFGIAGLFGKLVDAPSAVIVFGRTFFASIGLLIVLVALKKPIRPRSKADLGMLILLGLLLAVHWVTFFTAIQVSTVAMGLLTCSTFPLFVTFMEPWFFKEKLRLFDLMTAGLVLLGLWLIVPSLDITNHMTQGAFWGVMAGFTFALLSILNRKYVAIYSPIVITAYQNVIATVALFPGLFFLKWSIDVKDCFYLAILGIFCTALSHALFIRSLSNIKTQLASVIASLEPVYGIVFAFLLLGETPGQSTLMGGSLIVGAIMVATLKRPFKNKRVDDPSGRD
jgi:drug/metabolite transporter (DMT)-like permease